MSEAQANSPDATLLREMLASFWRVEDEKNSLRQKHREAIGSLSEQQAQAKARAKDAGHPLAVFNILVAEEKARRAATNREARLDEDEQDHLSMVRDALGDFADSPLGRAALGEEAAEEQDVRPRHLKGREKDRADRKAEKNAALDAVASTNGAAIEKGISKLN